MTVSSFHHWFLGLSLLGLSACTAHAESDSIVTHYTPQGINTYKGWVSNLSNGYVSVHVNGKHVYLMGNIKIEDP